MQAVVDSTYPIDLVFMEFLSLKMFAGCYEHILVITDHLTRYAHAIPTRNQSAKTNARILFDNFTCQYGFPSQLHSDQGRIFESEVIKKLCSMQKMINQGIILITQWAMKCQKCLIKRSLICLEPLRMTKSLTGKPTCLLWSMRTIQRTMKVLGTRLIF